MNDLEIPDLINTRQRALIDQFIDVRSRTVAICSHLEAEDHVVQPVPYVSPPKWHLAHSSWFFETFILLKSAPDYEPFDPQFGFLFNSYYESLGKRVLRTDRGNITRPGVSQVIAYRKYVDAELISFLKQKDHPSSVIEVLSIGLQHEMQHQELLLSDLKFILGHNPTFPVYDLENTIDQTPVAGGNEYLHFEAGIYQIGAGINTGNDATAFHFDNEEDRHKVYLESFEIAESLVTFGDYIGFIEAGGYQNFKYWHSDAWAWIEENEIKAPMYMHREGEGWYRYTLSGYKPINKKDALLHVSYYEAYAFAQYKGCRLPTEFEWEAAADRLRWGDAWEWTNSAYLPYPGFKTAPGAIGEYNGKFMINQMVLRGASRATSPNHSRKTYRNFFHPHLQWQYSGIRLAQ